MSSKSHTSVLNTEYFECVTAFEQRNMQKKKKCHVLVVHFKCAMVYASHILIRHLVVLCVWLMRDKLSTLLYLPTLCNVPLKMKKKKKKKKRQKKID